jgi:hypothetical protein
MTQGPDRGSLAAMSRRPELPDLPGGLAPALNRAAAILGALAVVVSTIYAAATSSPTLRGVIFAGLALSVTAVTREVGRTRRAGLAAQVAEAEALTAIARQRTAEAAAMPAARPGDQPA